MTVRLLFFSQIREVTGLTELDFPIGPQGSIPTGELLDRIFDRFPGLRDWDEKLLVAVNLEYVRREDLVRAGDEVALMPPVQGG